MQKRTLALILAMILGPALTAGPWVTITRDKNPDRLVLEAHGLPEKPDAKAWVTWEASDDLATWTVLKRKPGESAAPLKVKVDSKARFFRVRIEPR